MHAYIRHSVIHAYRHGFWTWYTRTHRHTHCMRNCKREREHKLIVTALGFLLSSSSSSRKIHRNYRNSKLLHLHWKLKPAGTISVPHADPQADPQIGALYDSRLSQSPPPPANNSPLILWHWTSFDASLGMQTKTGQFAQQFCRLWAYHHGFTGLYRSTEKLIDVKAFVTCKAKEFIHLVSQAGLLWEKNALTSFTQTSNLLSRKYVNCCYNNQVRRRRTAAISKSQTG